MERHNRCFGRVLRRLRRDMHLSQKDLAVHAGVDRTYISLLELGRRSPTLESIVALAAALKIPLSRLFAELEVEIARDVD
ncbi:transcriptional regulator, XRE family (plasmid) [Burkholderia vietnamiensis G4]|uniref:Transcriptional regulator, XRE family n=1 Tax=Burkholderia vietnamiensis (strain G4 / LMG 22486) TaxID=269482 RepID=A4JVH4_BURVG|nr:transcriptional regulator, XRE family [Burkholderia vietnamiensis G4]